MCQKERERERERDREKEKKRRKREKEERVILSVVEIVVVGDICDTPQLPYEC